MHARIDNNANFPSNHDTYYYEYSTRHHLLNKKRDVMLCYVMLCYVRGM